MPRSTKPAPLGTRVIKTLHPDQPGTHGWLRTYGEQLLFVRYRVDARGRTRYTTLELLVAAAPLHHREHPASPVYAALDGKERSLRERAQLLGAQWDETSRIWRMTLATAKLLGIKQKVHTKRRRKGDAAPNR